MIQVTEYARITTSSASKPSLSCGIVSKATFDWLLDIVALWKGSNPVAIIDGHETIKLGSYVGFLQSPSGESIEVLPKTGIGQTESLRARKLLQKMLNAALNVTPNQAGPASLLRSQQPLHEWIMSKFLNELHDLVSKGIRFDYERVEEESPYIRGQLRVDLQQRQPPGRGHLFQIRHDIFTPNRLENRLLKTALEYVRIICKSSENWRLANELSHRLIGIPTEPVPRISIQKWSHTKLMTSYETVFPWCELILEKLNPDFQNGSHKGISLLFPMERLFEKYVEKSLEKQLKKGQVLKPQASEQSLVKHTPYGFHEPISMFKLIPDLILRDDSKTQILDVKWKILDQSALDGNEKYGISQPDLYQLYTYGHKYQDGKGHMMLIYPYHDKLTKPLPPFYLSNELALWVVPFNLEEQLLIAGDWINYFKLNSTLTAETK